MSRVRTVCKHCGRGFLSKPYSRNSITYTCRRAKCEKASGIYQMKGRTRIVETAK